MPQVALCIWALGHKTRLSKKEECVISKVDYHFGTYIFQIQQRAIGMFLETKNNCSVLPTKLLSTFKHWTIQREEKELHIKGKDTMSNPRWPQLILQQNNRFPRHCLNESKFIMSSWPHNLFCYNTIHDRLFKFNLNEHFRTIKCVLHEQQ